MGYIHIFHFEEDGDVIMDGGELVWEDDTETEQKDDDGT